MMADGIANVSCARAVDQTTPAAPVRQQAGEGGEFKTPLDSPALKGGSRYYPESFGDRVPLRIRMTRTVRPDVVAGVAVSDCPPALKDHEYPAWCNANGAVCALVDGRALGVKPDEFEVTGWHEQRIPLAPKARRWRVVVRWHQEEVYEVDADNFTDAEKKALIRANRELAPDPEVDEAQQISGPPPAEPAVDLHLADGRLVSVPADLERRWFRVNDAPAPWWCNGQIAVILAEPPEEKHQNFRDVTWSALLRVVPSGVSPATADEDTRRLGPDHLGLEVRRLRTEDRSVLVDERLLPLVWCPEAGLVPQILDDLCCVLGYRDGQMVSLVMPVRE